MSVRNSLLVLSDLRKAPSIADVTVVAPGFCTPRIVMHICLWDASASVKNKQALLDCSIHSRRFHDDGNTHRLNGFFYSQGYLTREPFLDLKAA